MIDKKEITADWQKLLPSLSKRKLLELSNVIGPLVVNIQLKMGRGNTFYTPTYFIHNLCNEVLGSALTMTLVKHSMTIDIVNHNEKYRSMSEKLLNNVYVPIEEDLEIEEIIAGYNKYFKEALFIDRREYEDYVLICGWSGRRELIEQALHQVRIGVSKWPEERYVLPEMGGIKKWLNSLEERAYNQQNLIQISQNEAKRLKVDKLQQRKIIF